MKRFIFDIETNGLLNTLSKVHCMVLRDVDTGEVFRFNSQSNNIEEGINLLLTADEMIGHNAIKFDAPALQKLYAFFKPDYKKIKDTLVMSRLIYADIGDIDSGLMKKGKIPGSLFGSHSLEAWGHRLGKHKGDYAKQMEALGLDPWATWNEEMEEYCVGDTEVTYALLKKLESKEFSQESIELEHQVAVIIARQERYGFKFDKEAAIKLYAQLVQKKSDAEQALKIAFKPRYLKDGKVVTPKRDNKTLGYITGAEFQKVKLTEFNPGSRDHISLWLKAMYQWEPSEFTPDGKPKIDEQVLTQLSYPEVEYLKEYLMLDKRIGQLAEGNQAWLKKDTNGRIHGSVNTNGAVTGRMTHGNPNLAQVPAVRSSKQGILKGSSGGWGYECRSLFTVSRGKKLVGADAAALELRDLAGYMYAYDGGKYAHIVVKGNKDEGTDIHSVNARAIGLDPKQAYSGMSGRDIAKTWFYAFIYGAGDEKLGNILTGKKGEAAKSAGMKSRSSFMKNLPALNTLVTRVKAAVKERGFLKGLDGRRLTVRSQHAALNTLLQAAGACQMKKALVILDASLQEASYLPGVNYEFVANVHDEWQIEVDESIADLVGKLAVEAIKKAGEVLNFKCPLDGEYKIGNNWSETH